MIEYLENGDLAVYEGIRYRRDKKTGYYLNSARRMRLHRAVWQSIQGIIPDGYHVHHVDGDKSNNEPGNLALLPGGEHASKHGKQRDAMFHAELVRNLSVNARPKACEWHKSKEGRKWHAEHAKKMCENMNERRYTCEHCGETFFKKPLGANKFCSNACKSAHRRASGTDNEQRRCCVCGQLFETNKYSKTASCSRACANRMRTGGAYYPVRAGGCVQYGG